VSKLRITYNAPVVLTFTLAAVVVFVLNKTIPGTREWFVAVPRLERPSDYLGLITHILGHASWQHLLGNFMLILLLGPILEERHGSLPLLVMILITALVTGVINFALSSNGLLGASGIVFMMILLASTANIREGEIPLTFIAVAIIYLGGELIASFKTSDGISHLAHLVGGASGAALGFLGARKRAAPPLMLGDKKPPIVAVPTAKPTPKPTIKKTPAA
jgi:membrane associated rhomboid family serine protease